MTLNTDNLVINQRNMLARQEQDLTTSEEELALAKSLGAPNAVLNRIVNKIIRQKHTISTTRAYLDLLEAKTARKPRS
jgi:hypothetical protein